MTASLVLQSALEPLPGFSSSLLTLYVPVVLRDGASGLTNTGTVTVTICPCLRGGMQTEDRGKQKDRRWEKHMVCLPVPSPSTSLIFSLVTLLSMLACVTTLLGRCETFLWECLHSLSTSEITTNSTSLHSLVFFWCDFKCWPFCCGQSGQVTAFFTAVKKKKPRRDSDLWEAASETLRKIVWLCLLFAL